MYDILAQGPTQWTYQKGLILCCCLQVCIHNQSQVYSLREYKCIGDLLTFLQFSSLLVLQYRVPCSDKWPHKPSAQLVYGSMFLNL